MKAFEIRFLNLRTYSMICLIYVLYDRTGRVLSLQTADGSSVKASDAFLAKPLCVGHSFCSVGLYSVLVHFLYIQNLIFLYEYIFLLMFRIL